MGALGVAFINLPMAGDSWNKLSEGLPDSLMGKIGVVASPAQSGRVYAIIESNQGGLYRSGQCRKILGLNK